MRVAEGSGSFGVPLSSLASESTIANWVAGLALATVAVSGARRNPTLTIIVHFLAMNAVRFGA